MLPMYQSQTTQQAWLKHRRSISEALHKMNLNVTNEVAILFEKPEGSRDGRPMQQPAQITFRRPHGLRAKHFWMVVLSLVNSSKSQTSLHMTQRRNAQARLVGLSRLMVTSFSKVLEVWKQATLFPYQLELNKSMSLT